VEKDTKKVSREPTRNFMQSYTLQRIRKVLFVSSKGHCHEILVSTCDLTVSAGSLPVNGSVRQAAGKS
jgi:hypothetical protein